MSAARPPVIIIGMHRSGTSLLTRVLQQNGFFMGRGASRNEEAAFTNAVNAWIFRQASATWDRPESMDELLADEALRPWLLDYIGGIIRGPASLRFLGLRRGLRGGGLPGQTAPWGWKDPRNTYTLPLWLELFPDARVLHIVRHGVDVAESLRSRRRHALEGNIARYRRRRAAYRFSPFAPKRRGFGPQARCRTLEGGFGLWLQYLARAGEHTAALEDRALTVRYEDLLSRPRRELERALTFCGLRPDPRALESTVATFRADRAHAWRHDDALRAFAAARADELARFGYAAVPGEAP